MANPKVKVAWCEVCGEWIQCRNTLGVCQRNPQCKAVYARRLRDMHRDEIVAEQQEHKRQRQAKAPKCEVCGKWILARNKMSVCVRTPACEKENKRRWGLMFPDKLKAQYRRSYVKHRKARLAWQRAYDARTKRLAGAA